MKKVLLVCFILLLASWSQAASNEGIQKIKVSTDEVIQPRSLIEIPATAYLQGSTLYIHFIEEVPMASVSIINIETGEVSQYMDYSSIQDVCISLSSEEAGHYRLEITLSNNWVWGEFIL